MAFRIGSHVIAGELFNLSRNSVHGWLAFGPDEGIRIEVAGNLSGDLAGRHFRFEAKRPAASEDCPRASLDDLETQQIGVVGETALRMVRIPTVPVEEFYALAKQGLPLPEVVRPSLYLEWFSQNGRVVAEIPDVEITFDPQDEPGPEPEPLPESIEGAGPTIVGFVPGGEGGIEEIPFGGPEQEAEDSDPYELFPSDLEATLREQRAEGEPGEAFNGPPAQPQRRPWDEVIPGLDPETKRMYEEWDEVFDGEKDEPVAELFDPPLSLKPPSEIESEAEAESWLRVLLARLALHSLAIDICEHYSALATYRWLLDEILPGCKLHPRLPQIGFVQHYSTCEFCPECEARFDAEYKAQYPEG